MDYQQLSISGLSRRERVMQLHDAPLLMPSEWALHAVLSGVAATVIGLVVVYSFFSFIVRRFLSPSASTLKQNRLAYQATNLLVNSFLGVSGIYCELFTKPSRSLLVEEMITNYNQFQFFGTLQLGYQLWAIPVGVWLVHETTPMLVHHFATILVATMSSFCTNGFRFWGAFFYGFIEITSVPLSVMNTFKDHPSWIERHGPFYLVVRLIFALSFLYVRLYLFVPRMYLFLTDLFLITATSNNRFYQAYMAVVWLSSFFLQVLQVWWGWLILKGLLKVMLGSGGAKHEKLTTSNMNGLNKKES